jgi:hypothetical protein
VFARVRNHTRYDRNKLIMYKKGIGPKSLGSPLKQTTPKEDNSIKKGHQIPETTVTAALPSEKPTLKEAIDYSFKTGTTAVTWEKKQHPKMRNAHKNTPVMGYPPMVGGGKIAVKGFQLAKKAASKLSIYLPKVAMGAGEVMEVQQQYDKIKGKRK